MPDPASSGKDVLRAPYAYVNWTMHWSTQLH